MECHNIERAMRLWERHKADYSMWCALSNAPSDRRAYLRLEGINSSHSYPVTRTKADIPEIVEFARQDLARTRKELRSLGVVIEHDDSIDGAPPEPALSTDEVLIAMMHHDFPEQRVEVMTSAGRLEFVTGVIGSRLLTAPLTAEAIVASNAA